MFAIEPLRESFGPGAFTLECSVDDSSFARFVSSIDHLHSLLFPSSHPLDLRDALLKAGKEVVKTGSDSNDSS